MTEVFRTQALGHILQIPPFPFRVLEAALCPGPFKKMAQPAPFPVAGRCPSARERSPSPRLAQRTGSASAGHRHIFTLKEANAVQRAACIDAEAMQLSPGTSHQPPPAAAAGAKNLKIKFNGSRMLFKDPKAAPASPASGVASKEALPEAAAAATGAPPPAPSDPHSAQEPLRINSAAPGSGAAIIGAGGDAGGGSTAPLPSHQLVNGGTQSAPPDDQHYLQPPSEQLAEAAGREVNGTSVAHQQPGVGNPAKRMKVDSHHWRVPPSECQKPNHSDQPMPNVPAVGALRSSQEAADAPTQAAGTNDGSELQHAQQPADGAPKKKPSGLFSIKIKLPAKEPPPAAQAPLQTRQAAPPGLEAAAIVEKKKKKRKKLKEPDHNGEAPPSMPAARPFAAMAASGPSPSASHPACPATAGNAVKPAFKLKIKVGAPMAAAGNGRPKSFPDVPTPSSKPVPRAASAPAAHNKAAKVKGTGKQAAGKSAAAGSSKDRPGLARRRTGLGPAGKAKTVVKPATASTGTKAAAGIPSGLVSVPELPPPPLLFTPDAADTHLALPSVLDALTSPEDVTFVHPDSALDPDQGASALLLRDVHASLLRFVDGVYPRAVIKGRQPDASSYSPPDARAARWVERTWHVVQHKPVALVGGAAHAAAQALSNCEYCQLDTDQRIVLLKALLELALNSEIFREEAATKVRPSRSRHSAQTLCGHGLW